MLFSYQARDQSGVLRDGDVSAADVEEARRQLRQEGLYPILLEEKKAVAVGGGSGLFQKRITRSDVIYLTTQLAVMIDAGVPLSNALEGLAKQLQNPSLKSVLENVQQSVEGGEEFSTALARFPKQFDQTYVNLVKASEASGMLGPMLDRIAAQAQAELETKQKVRGALMYPAAMLVMCVGVSVFLLAFIFPKLTPMFATRAMELPAPTRFLMAVSNGLTHHTVWFVLAAAAIAGAGWYARRQPWGRTALDWFWLHVPVLGPMLRKVALSRSLRTLATTINAGVPVLQALELSAGVANNVFYERCWHHVADQVATGKQIHEALQGNRLFPPTLLQMISSGEATGKLGPVLNKVSDYFDREVANAVKSATSLVEPVMVFVMGGLIGTIALAMLLPIFKLSGHGG